MKKIFLTGASSGIGQATAEFLVARGDEVWGTSRDPNRLAARAGLHPIRLNLSEPNSIAGSFSGALQEAGAFDVVINNAGSGHFGPAEFLTPELLHEQFQVLVFAQMELCRLALAAMRERERGLIINISSLASRLPLPFMAAYNAAKAAMASFTMTLQLELERSQIRVVDLQPGDIRTNFNKVLERSGGGPYERRAAQAWAVSERNMKAAPPPQWVARRIAALIEDRNPPPRVTVAGPFQAVVAPALFSLLPPRLRVWGLRRYYDV